MKKLTDQEARQLTGYQPQGSYPKKVEDWYRIKLSKLINSWRKAVVTYSDMWLKDYVKSGALRMDADDDSNDDNSNDGSNDDSTPWVSEFITAFAQLRWYVDHKDSDAWLNELAKQYVRQVDNYGFNQSKVQMGVHGLNPVQHDVTLDDYTKAKIAENVTLIKSVRSDYLDGIEKAVYESITRGGTAGQLAKIIQDRTGIAYNRAKLIAVDQTGTIISQINAYRAKLAGAKRYIWHSVEDERVRPLHRKLDNTVQAYGDPDGGDHGMLPGEPIRCRCYAEPVY